MDVDGGGTQRRQHCKNAGEGTSAGNGEGTTAYEKAFIGRDTAAVVKTARGSRRIIMQAEDGE